MDATGDKIGRSYLSYFKPLVKKSYRQLPPPQKYKVQARHAVGFFSDSSCVYKMLLGQLVHNLTFDGAREFYRRQTVTRPSGVKIYFADLYSFW